MHNPDILNSLAAFIEARKNPPPTGDPILSKVGTTKAKATDDYDKTGQIRDSLSALVSAGYAGGPVGEKYRAHVTRLNQNLGAQQAQNLLTRIALFSKNPSTVGYSPEQRVSSFYDLNPIDPEMQKLMLQLKNFSTGPIGGLNSSPETVSMEASNRLPIQTIVKK